MSVTVEITKRDYRDTLAACEGRADLVMFSPPYCDARHYGMGVSWTMDDYAALGDACWSAVRPGGHVLVNVSAPVRDWDGRGTERGLHAFRLLIDWHDRIGFLTPDHLAYGRDGAPGKWSMLFRSGWEPLWWFRKPGEGRATFRPERLSTPATTAGHVKRRFTAHDGGGWSSGSLQVRADTRLPTSLLGYGRIDNGSEPTDGAHPARWSIRLARDLVACFSDPGDLVCDPFTGAGTSALAAVEAGRSFIGGDLGDKDDQTSWAAVALDLVKPVLQQASLFGAP